MSSKNSSSSTGVGFCGLLVITFIVLKLTGVIAWSWWIVLAPLWAPAVLAFLILIVGLLIIVRLHSKE